MLVHMYNIYHKYKFRGVKVKKRKFSESSKVLARLGGLDPVTRKNLRGPFPTYIKRVINK